MFYGDAEGSKSEIWPVLASERLQQMHLAHRGNSVGFKRFSTRGDSQF